MVKLTFVSAGSERIVDTKAGYTLMEAAVNNGIEGIDADCGGGCACGTCHVHIALDYADRFPPPDDAEAEMLALVQNRSPTSRLACQLSVDHDHDGMHIVIPHPNGPE